MRKLIALLALGLLVLSLASCGGGEEPEKDGNKNDQSGDVTYNEDGGVELPPIDVFPID